MDQKHNFALFDEQLLTRNRGKNSIIITDQELVHRITRVLRLAPQETVTLFNKTHHARFTLLSCDKKSVTGTLEIVTKNPCFAPTIRAILPLLKKDETDEAVYALCEMGVNEIWLTVTERTQRRWSGDHEQQRLERILIAAAEQSKHFNIPCINTPTAFNVLLNKIKDEDPTTNFIFCDPSGISLHDFILNKKNASCNSFTIIVGPEADLTTQEKEYIKQFNCTLLSLTPTILRANHAIVLACGIVRSL